MATMKAEVKDGKYVPLRGIVIGGTEITAATLAMNDLTATAAELNTLDGITASTAELNIMDGVTATAAEINKLDGAGAVVASGTAAAHQADLATDANGPAIAGAVNGLRDVLVAFGMMAAS